MSGASDDSYMDLASMDPRVPPQLLSLLSACSYSVPDGPSHPEYPAAPRPTHNTETTQQAEVAAVSPGAAESSTTRQVPRKRGRPRKTPDNGAALTSKEVCEHIVSESHEHRSFQRLIYRSAVDCKSSMRSVPTSHERK